MKQLLFILMTILLLSGTLISQQSHEFHAYEVTMIDNETKIRTRYNTDFTVIFTDDYVLFKDPDRKWEFIGNVFRVSKTSIYSYALDANDVRCRVWFKAKKSGFAILGLEYEDKSFLYELERINTRNTKNSL